MTNLHTGDCLAVMPTLEANSIDTIITDPPYGLEFMGKDWDHGVPGVAFWVEALRVARPGATLLAFGGTRTVHRLACAIEDAGWEIFDRIMWVYGSGFPKSHDISKAIDKAAGAEREEVGVTRAGITRNGRTDADGGIFVGGLPEELKHIPITAPATPAAELWHGWGTALKPAYEPIICARKPNDGTYANNALTHGVAGLWIDGARVGTTKNVPASVSRKAHANTYGEWAEYGETPGVGGHDPNLGRWPANLIHDGSDEVVALFPETASGGGNKSRNGTTAHTAIYGTYGPPPPDVREVDTGSAARFFYTAKASKAERDAGLEGMEGVPLNIDPDTGKTKYRKWGDQSGNDNMRPSSVARNHHPTVKPLELMRYLCRLTKTPTGGVVLDPFMGSGTTGCAAVLEGREFIGIEASEEYTEIARRRIAHWQGVADAEAAKPKQLTLGLD